MISRKKRGVLEKFGGKGQGRKKNEAFGACDRRATRSRRDRQGGAAGKEGTEVSRAIIEIKNREKRRAGGLSSNQ